MEMIEVVDVIPFRDCTGYYFDYRTLSSKIISRCQIAFENPECKRVLNFFLTNSKAKLSLEYEYENVVKLRGDVFPKEILAFIDK